MLQVVSNNASLPPLTMEELEEAMTDIKLQMLREWLNSYKGRSVSLDRKIGWILRRLEDEDQHMVLLWLNYGLKAIGEDIVVKDLSRISNFSIYDLFFLVEIGLGVYYTTVKPIVEDNTLEKKLLSYALRVENVADTVLDTIEFYYDPEFTKDAKDFQHLLDLRPFKSYFKSLYSLCHMLKDSLITNYDRGVLDIGDYRDDIIYVLTYELENIPDDLKLVLPHFDQSLRDYLEFFKTEAIKLKK